MLWSAKSMAGLDSHRPVDSGKLASPYEPPDPARDRRNDRITGLFCCGCAQPLLAGCVAKLFQQVSCWRAILWAGLVGSTLSRSNFGLAKFSLRTRGMIS